MGEAFLLAGVRTPIGKFLGQLSGLSAPELGAIAIRESLSRAGIRAEDVDEVILGNVLSAGLGQAPARQAALKAGLPATVAAVTINKVCGSGLESRDARRPSRARGGCENPRRRRHGEHVRRPARRPRPAHRAETRQPADGRCAAQRWFDVCLWRIATWGLTPKSTARKHGITREDQDQFAAESQRRASQAIEERAFDAEIVPVTVRIKRTETTITQDEGPRPDTTAEQLAALKPAFEAQGSVTAGNASMLSDGAAAVIVCDADTARNSPTAWKAKVLASHTSGTAPEDLFDRPGARGAGRFGESRLKSRRHRSLRNQRSLRLADVGLRPGTALGSRTA